MKYARIEDGYVLEVIDFDPAGKFHPAIIWQEVPDDVVAGATTEDGVNFTPPPDMPELEQPVEPDLETVREQRAKAARDAADAFMDFLTAKYSKYEKDSWPKQEAQAVELTSDANASAPFVRRMAARRGIDVDVLRQKIMNNVAVADFVASDILGQQQAYEDQIRAAETIEEAYAIQFEYEVPELPGEGGNG